MRGLLPNPYTHGIQRQAPVLVLDEILDAFFTRSPNVPGFIENAPRLGKSSTFSSDLKFVFRPRNLLGLVGTCPSRLKEEPLELFLFVQEQHQPDPLQVGWYLDR